MANVLFINIAVKGFYEGCRRFRGSEKGNAAIARLDSKYTLLACELEELYSIKMPRHFLGLNYHTKNL
ncbi:MULTISPECIES: hypothetical protein [unclassified Sporolactobacillus]|uniref:hypothetical protein n=1 Tax=unclassified Sporolactobacillus TaxID=2628533 RepID=UPI0023685DAA|nr:hypothetical protein [Sporolactobacillus sp. CQH2019]MDD9150837.1 hypothetical protein [Sporolactobacillus sp. CQH2019]